MNDEEDKQDLVLKALFEADKHGLESEDAALLIMQLRVLLERIL